MISSKQAKNKLFPNKNCQGILETSCINALHVQDVTSERLLLVRLFIVVVGIRHYDAVEVGDLTAETKRQTTNQSSFKAKNYAYTGEKENGMKVSLGNWLKTTEVKKMEARGVRGGRKGKQGLTNPTMASIISATWSCPSGEVNTESGSFLPTVKLRSLRSSMSRCSVVKPC